MADKDNEKTDEELSFSEQMDEIYGDTDFFIKTISAEYGFYGRFIESLGNNNDAKLSINRTLIEKKIDLMWVEAIEQALPALDTAMRNPSVGIKETEEILPVELSHHITERSLRHLAMHTDYIQKIEGDMIIPSKILNCYYEENKLTYENKFLNTLLDRLLFFVDRRYSVFKEKGATETELSLDFSGPFKVYGASGKISVKIDASMPEGANGDTTISRVDNIYKTLVRYKSSEFVKSLEGATINPPVMRTNAIKKNKYLSQCLDLWDFIESYDKVGYTVDSATDIENADDHYIYGFYSVLSMMYFMFEYNMNRRFRKNKVPLETVKASPIKPEFIKHIEAIKAERFNVIDTEYKKVINVFGTQKQKKLSAEEKKISAAVKKAIADDKLFEAELKKAKKAAKNNDKTVATANGDELSQSENNVSLLSENETLPENKNVVHLGAKKASFKIRNMKRAKVRKLQRKKTQN